MACLIKKGDRELLCSRCVTPIFSRGKYRCKIYKRVLRKECKINTGIITDYLDEELE